MNGFRIFQPTLAFHPHPSMHSPDNSTHSQLEMLETLSQQSYHSVHLWKSTLEATLFHLHTLQEWPILCPVWKYGWWLSLHLSSPKFVWSERWKNRCLIHVDNIFFHNLSHLLFPLSSAWNWVHLMLPPQESTKIHLYPSGISIPVPSMTYA